ncbi:amino acid adenylation domain-containing protein [Sinorhizobium meliloti]|uniref:amino acid adenylation domain-containing protein n=1 Tax=Rhizobium meliloti TaxID=382 RepID=UPI003F1775E1
MNAYQEFAETVDFAAELTHSQKRFWLLHQLAGDKGAGSLGFTLRLRGSLDVTALESAICQVVETHTSLRTEFFLQDEMPYQRISPNNHPPLSLRDLSSHADAEVELKAHIAEAMKRPFDLAAGPLFRTILFRLSDNTHVLLFNAHHIILDGVSVTVLFKDLARFYDEQWREGVGKSKGRQLQYLDFCNDERARLSPAQIDDLSSGWKSILSGAPLIVDIPSDLSRPAQLSYRVATHQLELPGPLQEAATTLANKAGVTLYTIFLAAFCAVLSRWSRQDEMLIGVPVAGRPHRSYFDVVGCFVNTLPVRCSADPDLTIDEFLGNIGQSLSRTYAGQALPFEQIVEAIGPERDPSRAPLIQAVCNYFKVDVAPWTKLGFEAEFRQVYRPPHGQDLCLSIETSGDSYIVYLEYAADLFNPETSGRILKHWLNAVSAFADNPTQRLGEVDFLDYDERYKLLEHSRGVQSDAPQVTLDRLFWAQVAQTPEAIAVIDGDKRLTFKELDQASNRLANKLRSVGATHGSFVATLLPESHDVVVAWLAIVKLGGAFIPLDSDWPESRIMHVIHEQKCIVATTTEISARAFLPATGIVLVDDDSPASNLFEPVNSKLDQPLYVIYTSGSTGLPKGVVNTQAGVLNRLNWMTREFGARAASRALKTTRQIFDSAVWQIFWPLINGGAVVLVDVRNTSPLTIFKMLQDEAITIVDFVPSLFSSFQSELAHSPESRYFLETGARFPELQIVIFGGEEIGRSGVDWFLKRSPARVINLYGPTEVSIGCVFQEISSDFVGTIPIGRPIDNIGAYILDDQFSLVPFGVPGELCLTGIGLAQGYAGQPALTADRFVPNPFASGERLYRTGDLAKRRADGAIIYLGRLDTQIKLNGVRIEPGEIETAIKRATPVKDAVVDVREDGLRRKRLVAYIVMSSGVAPLSSAGFRNALRSVLPSHLIPSVFVVIDKIPLAAGGKLDGRALPDPPNDTVSEYAPPQTSTETRLAKLWSDLLAVSDVGRLDNFFERGGHSLMATRMTSRVRDEFGVELKLLDLFETTDLSQLAARIDAASSATKVQPILPSCLTKTAPRVAPLSFNQQQLWILENVGGGGAAYNLSKVLRLKGYLNTGALSLALTEIVRRHEALRTRFESRDGSAVQVINEPWSILLRARSIAQDDLHEVVSQTVEAPFLLSKDHLFRSQLLTLAPDEHVLILVMHHIVSDGWSMSILLDELTAIYNSLLTASPTSLEQPVVQYADYALWQRETLTTREVEDQLTFWKNALAGAPPHLDLPVDKPRPVTRSYKGDVLSFMMPAHAMTGAAALARSLGTTLYNVLLSSFQVTLSKWTAQTDIVIGSLNAGRSRSEIESVIGYFVNMVALRADLSASHSFRDLVAQNTRMNLDANANLDVTFDKLVEAVRPVRDTSRQPIFQVLFALQNMPRSSSRMVDLRLEEIDPKRTTAKLDLSVFVTETDHGFSAAIEYATDILEHRTIERFAQRWMAVLESSLADPDVPLDDITILMSDERAMLVEEWARSSPEANRQLLLTDLFTEQARRAPSAIAVSFDGRHMSYAELARRSDELAAHLLSLGVEPGAIIGLCVERSPSLVVGALGILKAGAAYLPLDPSYPADRLVYMVDDAKARIVITDERSRATVPSAVDQVVDLDHCSEWSHARSPKWPVSLSPDTAAYVIYTSGSTGKPKGVVVSHRNVTRLLSSTQSNFRFDGNDVWTLFHSFSFDFSVWEFWGALAFGGRLVIVPYLTSRSPDDFAQLLVDENVTVLNQTPSAFGAVSQAILAKGMSLPSLRYVIFGGEKLVISSLRTWFDRFGDTTPKLVNMYGITETTVHVTYREITRADLDGTSESVIGRPLSDLQVFILDAQLNLVPVGTPGEMYIAGEGLAQGYLNQPGLTADRFVPSPFLPPGRLYKTGDLARWRANGDIDYLGRIDQQVKLRGFRIELGEIEAALVSLPGIKEAAVVLAGSQGNQWLAAYVVASHDLPAADFKHDLRRRLPEHMVPSTITHLDRLPLTSNGKLNRAALPVPERVQTRGPISTASWSSTQKRLSDIFRRILATEQIDLHENFFELGGHSLLAIRLCSQIEEQFGGKIPVGLIFERPTIAALADWMERPVDATTPRFRIALRSGSGSRNVICFLPTALGTGVYYADISQRLCATADVVTCRLPGTVPGETPAETIEEMAAHCIAQLVDAGDYDSWTFIGWSFGGVLAYEMARQMAESGLPMPKIVLIDSFIATAHSSEGESSAQREAEDHSTFEQYLENIFEQSDHGLSQKSNATENRLRAFLDSADGELHRQVFDRCLTALKRYRAKSFDGHIFEIRATQSPLNVGCNADVQALPAAARSVRELAGDHFSIMRGDRLPLISTLNEIISSESMAI